MQISNAGKIALDQALAKVFYGAASAADWFRPTVEWNSFGLLLERPSVLELAPSLVYSEEWGIWNIEIRGAAPAQAQRGELLETTCAAIASALKISWGDPAV